MDRSFNLFGPFGSEVTQAEFSSPMRIKNTITDSEARYENAQSSNANH